MSYRDILVHQAQDGQADARLKYALSLAQAFGAKLTGFYALEFPVIPGFASAQIPADVLQQHYNEIRGQATQRRDVFEAEMGRTNLQSDFHIAEGNPFDTLPLAARATDLIVVSQPDPDNPAPQNPVLQSLLLSAGRPVLMVPYAGDHAAPPKRIMIAWTPTRECTRAIHDALPLLQRAEAMVFSVNPQPELSDEGEIVGHLTNHGVKAAAKQTSARDISVGEAILSAIADNGVELLVMGAYGHSRLRETMLGGATRAIIEAMTCPVLLSH
jgi:nucleotide-binding universal stress UspA family protein